MHTITTFGASSWTRYRAISWLIITKFDVFFLRRQLGTMALIGAIFLAFCANAHASFDRLDEEGLIPSDGFHDLLGLVPFWMVDRSSVALRRTLGGRYYNPGYTKSINISMNEIILCFIRVTCYALFSP